MTKMRRFPFTWHDMFMAALLGFILGMAVGVAASPTFFP